LVVIARHVDPIELVVYLPALCRKMGVIVKGKAHLGTVVHKKAAAVLTVQDVKSEDQRELTTTIKTSAINGVASVAKSQHECCTNPQRLLAKLLTIPPSESLTG
jgi:hypothetical protein